MFLTKNYYYCSRQIQDTIMFTYINAYPLNAHF